MPAAGRLLAAFRAFALIAVTLIVPLIAMELRSPASHESAYIEALQVQTRLAVGV
jgi:hypothetical protein